MAVGISALLAMSWALVAGPPTLPPLPGTTTVVPRIETAETPPQATPPNQATPAPEPRPPLSPVPPPLETPAPASDAGNPTAATSARDVAPLPNASPEASSPAPTAVASAVAPRVSSPPPLKLQRASVLHATRPCTHYPAPLVRQRHGTDLKNPFRPLQSAPHCARTDRDHRALRRRPERDLKNPFSPPRIARAYTSRDLKDPFTGRREPPLPPAPRFEVRPPNGLAAPRVSPDIRDPFDGRFPGRTTPRTRDLKAPF